MRSISLRAWLLVCLSAGLQVVVFPTGGPMPVWRAALCWIALVPLLAALSLPGRNGSLLSLRSSVLLGYLCGFLWYFGNCFWIYQTMYLYGGLPKPVSFGIVVLFSLYLGFYHALFAGTFASLRRSRAGAGGALILTPFLWVAVELARDRITGFPWDLLGNALVDNQFVTKIAPLAGVMGISFLVAAINAGLAAGLLFPGRRRLRMVAGVAAVLAGLLQAAMLMNSAQRLGPQPKQQAVMLQENLSVGVTGRSEQPLSEEQELEDFTRLSLAPVIGGAGAQGARPTILLWPEAPSHLRSDEPWLRSALGALARQAQAPVIAGTLGVDANPASPRGVNVYDSAMLVDGGGSYSGRYDKIHLVPWGEYVPFKAVFSFAEKLTEGVGNMDAGHDRTVFHTGGHSYGIFICYESIFGDEVREFVNHGAEVLVNLSDDGWYGETGAPWQHLNMARMRAIENRRWVLRATNTGVTTAIDPEGRITVEAPRHVRAAFMFPFEFERGTTFYTRHGDWFAYLCVLVTLLAVGARWRVSGSFKAGRVG